LEDDDNSFSTVLEKANLHARKQLLICIGNPRCPVPGRKVRNNVRVPHTCQVSNQLPPNDYHVITHLCEEHAIKEEIPIFVANEEDLVEEE
jgi:hypothetical protein